MRDRMDIGTPRPNCARRRMAHRLQRRRHRRPDRRQPAVAQGSGTSPPGAREACALHTQTEDAGHAQEARQGNLLGGLAPSLHPRHSSSSALLPRSTSWMNRPQIPMSAYALLRKVAASSGTPISMPRVLPANRRDRRHRSMTSPASNERHRFGSEPMF
jgi:hypothetical protein